MNDFWKGFYTGFAAGWLLRVAAIGILVLLGLLKFDFNALG